MKKVSRRLVRAEVRVGTVVTLLASLLLPTGVPASAQATANIEFLNPSSFAAAPDTGITVSDNVPSNPDTGDETYRLSAWVSGVPQSPAVEFELLTRQGISLEVIDDVERVGTDTFEADWDIPDTLPDGPYTMRATLASGVVGIDNADQPIIIQRLADRAEITYPDNRSGPGQYGMFLPLPTTTGADGTLEQQKAIGNIELLNTGSAPGSGTARVRAFYTVSQPGTQPEWLTCGTESAGGATIPSGAANNGVRCTLTASQHLSSVTAVAVVANNTKESYQAALNQGGDATRVLEPYSQVPSQLKVITGATGTVDSGACHLVEVEVTDQFSREVLAANLDVHAWGPTDRLKFDTGAFEDYESVPPGDGHASEKGVSCVSPDETESVDPQGEHQIIGGPDMKHVEALPSGNPVGTNDNGVWGFALYSPEGSATAERHTTYWEVWLDETNTGSGVNNDAYDANELCRSGLVGWDSAASSAPMTGPTPSCTNPPEPPPCDTGATGSAQPCPSESPSPTESPSPDPTTPADGSTSIETNRAKVRKGGRVRFSGTIESTDACKAARDVELQARRPGRRFRTRMSTASDGAGEWSLRARQNRTRVWRAVVRETAGCQAIKSDVVKVKVARRR